MSKKKYEVTLNVDVQRALNLFPFIENKNVTLLDREEKTSLYSLCDSATASSASHFLCFWDKHPIEGTPFHCPIRKVYKGEQKTYKSNINGHTYTMNDNLNTSSFYYETDGHFCSVECCLAFLDDEESRNPLYANSRHLILAALGDEPKHAPSWRVLTAFGGTMSIVDFRASFVHKEYVLEEVASGVYPYIYRFKEAWHL